MQESAANYCESILPTSLALYRRQQTTRSSEDTNFRYKWDSKNLKIDKMLGWQDVRTLWGRVCYKIFGAALLLSESSKSHQLRNPFPWRLVYCVDKSLRSFHEILTSSDARNRLRIMAFEMLDLLQGNAGECRQLSSISEYSTYRAKSLLWLDFYLWSNC